MKNIFGNSLIKYYYDNERYFFNLVKKHCGYDEEKTKDVIYDCILKVAQIKEENIKHNLSFRSFWIITFKNYIIDKHRASSRRGHRVDLAFATEELIVQHHDFDKNIMMEEVNKLPKHVKQVMLYFIKGIRQKDIEDILDMNSCTVRGYVHRARKILKEKFQELDLLC